MNIAVILGGGKGSRMGGKVNKILLSLADKPLIYHTIKKFEDCSDVDEIILVINKDDIDETKLLVSKYKFNKIKKVIEGGEERQDSVCNGIRAIENGMEEDVVLIHNAANPFVSEESIVEVIKAVKDHGAAVAAHKAKDTIKEVDLYGFVERTLERDKLWQMQTPQGMKYGVALKAFEKAYTDDVYATDDVALVERIGGRVKVIETNKENIKVTNPSDLVFAEKVIGDRIGVGQDSHRFEDGKKLMLGGVEIPFGKGLKGNSDGDVILHSLFNALSQAIGMRSIGCYADKMCLEEGIKDSKEYVKFILGKLSEYKINNVGIMVEGKEPKLEAHHDMIKEAVAELIGVEVGGVGLTFTSGEELTEFGKGMGMQAFSAVLLSRK
ncbi:MAG: 2-C-methyl-D-erythritol 4-phosphate cytidylyltransferase [Candidatus Woesearchaeota archaeon]|jgi:2-C-methyl-D-erythritol 4-phosphate cytidylyltransferase/2-C-methyl-D-erythritol 2,4-cyclodiphosphate synthase|nr:2-C-methyl-D-erythritol 4-phosphate cytidylyltransferase [Candidatus Woesearchaeota archaeon]MDP7457453.1 2-C-methyl-D-erythritol 4-phosphate cytidylyltransferase [Candidatus Woesearchaeota archaeon]